MFLLLIIYWVAGYWATKETIYADKIIIYRQGELFNQRMIWGFVLGWFIIPWAIIKRYRRRR